MGFNQHIPNMIFTSWVLLLFFSSEIATAQDRSNLKRYNKENSQLPMTKPNEHRVVFMGNSITESWSSIHPEFFINKPYINRGISGQTTPQMLSRFRQDVIDLQPAVVVILAGINDIAENMGPIPLERTVCNIVSMAQLAIANDIEVILCSVLPAYDFPWRPGLNPANKVLELNQQLEAYACDNNIVYVDYFSAMVNEINGLKKELGSDDIHPNKAGYMIMEPLVENAIVKTKEI